MTEHERRSWGERDWIACEDHVADLLFVGTQLYLRELLSLGDARTRQHRQMEQTKQGVVEPRYLDSTVADLVRALSLLIPRSGEVSLKSADVPSHSLQGNGSL